eukprot:TRINITY_DN16973_c0_g1_i2.p1 TRINITY_DN16973_c0_g1~~TRINITY_DN16973_c0_g1_i2.p1  ORF type:complete len:473 (-),score=100.80 TRINITY_DN16973_c0_g1_i2:117-1535(-)
MLRSLVGSEMCIRDSNQFQEGHGTRKKWRTGMRGFELTMQELVHCRYGEIREGPVDELAAIEESQLYRLGADTLWKYERLRHSIQIPFSTRYRYPSLKLTYPTLDMLAGAAQAVDEAASRQEQDDASLNFTTGLLVKIPHLLTQAELGTLQKRAEYRQDSDSILITVNSMYGAYVASYQKDMICVVSYTDFEGIVHEKRSEVVTDDEHPVWNFTVQLHLYNKKKLEKTKAKQLDDHQKRHASVQFRVLYKRPGVAGLQTFAEANQLCLAGRNMCLVKEDSKVQSSSTSLSRYNSSTSPLPQTPRPRRWTDGWFNTKGDFFSPRNSGPLYFKPYKIQGGNDLTEETDCGLDLFHPGMGLATRKQGTLAVVIRKLLHVNEADLEAEPPLRPKPDPGAESEDVAVGLSELAPLESVGVEPSAAAGEIDPEIEIGIQQSEHHDQDHQMSPTGAGGLAMDCRTPRSISRSSSPMDQL